MKIVLGDKCIDTARVKMLVKMTFSNGAVSKHLTTPKKLSEGIFRGIVVKFEVLKTWA